MLCKSPSYLSSLNHKQDPHFLFFISEITFIWNFLEPEPKIANHFGSGSEILELFRRARNTLLRPMSASSYTQRTREKEKLPIRGYTSHFQEKARSPPIT